MVGSHLDRIVYLNGDFVVGREACLSIFDRGLLFADAVYEGFGVLDRGIIDFAMHMQRLRRSLHEVAIPMPLADEDVRIVLDRLVAENGIDEGFLYLQITRGVADRDYCHDGELVPTVFAFVQPRMRDGADDPPRAVGLRSQTDLRWKRRDIKSTNLLGQVLAKQAAVDAGGYEALLVDEHGYVTEGGATSFFIVREGAIVARPVSNEILHGITRQAMLKIAETEGLDITERRFTLREAIEAEEAFLTGASSYVEPVGEIDGRPIGNGKPGRITLKLRTLYLQMLRQSEE